MDAKDLRTETTLGERSNDGSSKFVAAHPCSSNKPYDSVPPNPLAKVETPTSRPCAVIGPDRVVPPPPSGDAYVKKGYEPWPTMDNTYRQPPEYPHKMPSYLSPLGNISPRQTFQENMPRIMVQPTYNSKVNEDASYAMDRNLSKKFNGTTEPKYCDVPYTVNQINSDQKNAEMCVPNMNNPRNCPQMWHPSGTNIRPARPYGAQELYQFPEYASCAGPRPMPITRPHRTINEEPGQVYSEAYYHDSNIRYKPYPNAKERYPQPRYEYVTNYTNPFHPPNPYPPYKYDMQKPLPPHPTHSQVPIKYVDNRMPDPILDGYQRPIQGPYVAAYRNQVIHPTYGTMLGGNLPNKMYPYPPDGPVKSIVSNKPPHDNKMYVDYDVARNKGYPMSENFYDMRLHMKNQVAMSNYPPANMPPMHPHAYYRKENVAAKNFEYMSHMRHLDPSLNPNTLSKLSSQFSPSSIAISPSDSNTSNDTAHTQGGSLEDCGYVSQSSTGSIRSVDSNMNRIMPNDYHRRYNYPYPSTVRTSPMTSKPDVNGNPSNRNKKGIDVRQFLQMWNEGDEENNGNTKQVALQPEHSNTSKVLNQYEVAKNHEQLYVLGLMNVPSEELGKYEHIQKVSKLPENIKGYNNIELLKHFEEAIESSNLSHLNQKQSISRNYQSFTKNPILHSLPPRPLSPLDVESKISQSVIHKEVGCNFEIKPCSPEMLNVEIATPAQNIINERTIEKVSNPLVVNTPMLNSPNGKENTCNVVKQNDHTLILNENNKIPSCKMLNTQCLNSDTTNVVKANYSLQDLESNAGVCLASLPSLDNVIELNFPEVNQQFINANKESVITTTDMNTKPNNMLYKINVSADEVAPSPKVLSTESDKEFCKLSKYRKIKRSDGNEKQFQINFQSLRTDSVIIKNPENPKSFEHTTENQFIDKKETEKIGVELLSPASHESDNYKHKVLSNEIAIDFSLNKIDSNKHSHNLANPLTEEENVNISKTGPYTEETFVDTNNLNDLTLQKNGINLDNTVSESSITSSILPLNTREKELDNTRDEKEKEESNLPHVVAPNGLKNLNEISVSECDIRTDNKPNTLTKENIEVKETIIEASNNISNTKKLICYDKSKHDTNKEKIKDSESLSLSNVDDEYYISGVISDPEKNNFSTFETEDVVLNRVDMSDSKTNNILPIAEKTEISPVVSQDSNENNDDDISSEFINVCEEKMDPTSESVSAFNIHCSLSNVQQQFNESCNTNSKTHKNEIDILHTSDSCDNKIDNLIKENNSDTHEISEDKKNEAMSLTGRDVSLMNIDSSDGNTESLDTFGSQIRSDNDCNEHIVSTYNALSKFKKCIENRPENIDDKLNTDLKPPDSSQIESDSNSSIDPDSSSINVKRDAEAKKNTNIQDEEMMSPKLHDVSFKDNSSSGSNIIFSMECCTSIDANVVSIGSDSADTNLNSEVNVISNSIEKCSEAPIEHVISSTNSDIINEQVLENTTDIVYSNPKEELCAKCETLNTFGISSNKINYMNGHNTKTTLKKEMFSPWIQKLVLRFEGKCVNNIFIKSDNKEEKSSVIPETNQKSHVDFSENINKSTKSENTNKVDYTLTDYTFGKGDPDVSEHKPCDVEISNDKCADDHCGAETIADDSNEIAETEYMKEDSGIYEIENESNINENSDTQLIDENRCNISFQDLHDIDCEEDSIEKSLNEIHSESPVQPLKLIKDKEPIFSKPNLKRSLSESALDMYNSDIQENLNSTKKFRKKFINMINIHNNRRNSISSVYTKDNMSFCIVIDNNCIITEENEEEDKICFGISEECLETIHNDSVNECDLESTNEIILCPEDDNCQYVEPLILQISDEKSYEDSWVDDVACVETVVSDDIAEDVVISAPSSPRDIDNESDDDDPNIFNSEHTEKVKYIYGNDKMCNDDAELVETLFRTPQMDVNKTLINREPHVSDDCDRYENDHEENVSLNLNESLSNKPESNCIPEDMFKNNPSHDVKEIRDIHNNAVDSINDLSMSCSVKEPSPVETYSNNSNISDEKTFDDNVNCDNEFTFKHEESGSAFSSPEVSSTTPEEKNSTILLKITNYKGTRISHLTDLNSNRSKNNSCRFTENVNYSSFQSNSTKPRPLITKAAQKYIPPPKDTVADDLKVKLPLPHHSLLKFKQLKISRNERKTHEMSKKNISKKQKPLFEDVLKSIDELQFKLHKDKSKKPKKSVPKVVIKKNENGSHYASTPIKESFNPDLTGRKWQPWVFIEKNIFIDKMAIRKKTKAIYNHRKNTYVFADQFKKYKSIPSAKFVISQPKDDSSAGQFKYTIRLKHSY